MSIEGRRLQHSGLPTTVFLKMCSQGLLPVQTAQPRSQTGQGRLPVNELQELCGLGEDGLCCRRARLKLTAPTATLDTPSPISSTESTKRLPIIWPLVHILPRSSFLPDQRGKPTIHLLSSSISLPLPAPNPKTFLSSPVKHNPQRLAFQNRRPSSLTRPEAKEPLHPLARSDRDRRRICPGSVVGVQERGAHQLQGFQEGAGNLEEPGRQESRSRGAVQSSASSQVSAGKARSPVAPRPLRALRRGSALLP